MNPLYDYLNNMGDHDPAPLFSARGVQVHTEGDLYLFKYHMLDVDWKFAPARFSRGAIYRKHGVEWTPVATPFDKFFNHDEGKCEIFGKRKIQLPDLRLAEKVDGSCLTVWNDGEKWRVSTLHKITTAPFVYGSSETFEDRFWKMSGVDTSLLDPSCTYIFEICISENRIVTEYARDHCVLLGVRETRTGIHRGLDSSIGSNVRLPHFIEVDGCMNGILREVEKRSTFQDEYILDKPEGYVLWSGHRPVAKIKNSRYVNLHPVVNGARKTLQHAHAKKSVVRLIFLGHFDDVQGSLSEDLQVFAEKVSEQVRGMMREVSDAMTHIHSRTWERKELAAYMQSLPQLFRGFFLSNISTVLDGRHIEMDALYDFLREPRTLKKVVKEFV